MKPLIQADTSELAGVRFVLADVDDTLTYRGRLISVTRQMDEVEIFFAYCAMHKPSFL
ncbi:hypothetical protein FHX15_005159 [Rhizobium sp. BK650]|uniref:hypothetical protein n=1 Tax=Rhizobium sp. BK650 TaxID=2586990 RepID=UPI001621AC45|nr:hypothetical protein [Rhizobium sp. BK650]MBB3659890.1 hypothetical protein [Rhizobium sp. BK650]